MIPSDAIRLAALGILAQGPRPYADLAAEVRHFVSHITGPSLDLMGTSLELLRHEGLVEPASPERASLTYTDPAVELRITEDGRREMEALLSAPVRGPINDLTKLVIALKMRFLHLLDSEGRRAQADMLIEICEAELARLRDLRAHHGEDSGDLQAWVDHELGQVRERLAWFQALRERL